MTEDLFLFDSRYDGKVAGVDEAGRGPLAGPVVCAACIMPKDRFIDGVNDSKKLSAIKREKLYEQIVREAIAYRVSVIDREIIDEINILNATKRGMRDAIEGLSVQPDIVLLDAVKLDLDVPSVSIIKGDAKSYAIAAASILAKVTRDRLMDEFDAQYPAYRFKENKGYGTAAHVAAIEAYGLSPIHRRSFHLKKGGAHGK